MISVKRVVDFVTRSKDRAAALDSVRDELDADSMPRYQRVLDELDKLEQSIKQSKSLPPPRH